MRSFKYCGISKHPRVLTRGCLPSSKGFLKEIAVSLNNNYHYLFQEYIDYSHDKNLRIVIIHNKCCSVYSLNEADYKLTVNISTGWRVIKDVFANLPEAEELVLKAYNYMGFNISIVDFLFEKMEVLKPVHRSISSE
jgi:glutathione synthase/RimK-type ligase-like ATP-grasp enzyme